MPWQPLTVPNSLQLGSERTVRDALLAGRALLCSAGLTDPHLESRLLLQHVLQISHAALYAHPEKRLSATESSVFEALITRRARREPYAYLVGAQSWLDFELCVDRNVLIPRPETEQLVQLAVEVLEDGRRATVEWAPVVVDVGTGSGAIAIAVARAFPEASVFATDVSVGALSTAAANVARLAPGRVTLLAGDLLEPIPYRAALLVANLPYIPSGEIGQLEPELRYEPCQALDGGRDGLEAIRALLEEAPLALAPGAHIVLECGHNQARAIEALALSDPRYAAVRIVRDLGSVERFVGLQVCQEGMGH